MESVALELEGPWITESRDTDELDWIWQPDVRVNMMRLG